MGLLAWTFLGLLLRGGQATEPGGAPVRAAYFYHYMGADHLDSLAARRFNRALIHWIPDSLGAAGARELSVFTSRGLAAGVEVVPEWLLRNPSRLASRPPGRRYTWGAGTVERASACPLDSLFWRSALLDRAIEFMTAAPGIRRLALDLELDGGKRHHYDAGPCRCGWCLALYASAHAASADRVPASGLLEFEERRLERVLTGMLAELAQRYPGVELGVLDLDYDSFVHRALGRALARLPMATADYSERSYAAAGPSLRAARQRLDALGLAEAPLIGGLWLKRFAPGDLPGAARSVVTGSHGYFVFTTFSLWLDPEKLRGPYTLLGPQAEYWNALAEVNQP